MRRLLAALLVVLPFAHTQAASPALPQEPAAAEPKQTLAPPPPADVLEKIGAPAVRPVLKTKAGYTVEVDLSKQVLSVNSPKKDIWISPVVEGSQTVEVTTDGAPLQKVSTVLARLKKGRVLFVTEEKGDWVLTQILAGDKPVRGWVQKKHLKPVAEDRPPQVSLAGQAGGSFASSAMLIQKGKQFDDGLYAAVELAVQNGLGQVTGKKVWLPRFAKKVDATSGGVPLAQLFAAAQLGGNKLAPPPKLVPVVESELKEFLADDKRSKPIGFYPWSKELESIFRQDRMLQTPNLAVEHRAGILAVAKALAADSETRKTYDQVLRLNERLTNPLDGISYQDVLAAQEAKKPLPSGPNDYVSFIPPSRSHETDLIMKLYGGTPIPEGFELMTEVIARLKSGKLSFMPDEKSGWYDHQLWSLEPLVRLDMTPESLRLQLNDEYKKHLEELFKGTYALMRETHVKQLAVPAAAREAPPLKEREKVFISPDPHVELLPTMYLRRAQSYHFVRQVLEETFGQENIKQMHRLTLGGPVEMNLADELDQLERLFSGAYVVACREIGMKEELPAGLGAGQSADDQAKTFLRWVYSLPSDPDLAPDSRMMVPVFYDLERKKSKVWLMLGWEDAGCGIGYVKQPSIKITDPEGKPVAFGMPGGSDDAPEIHFNGSWRSLATPVFAEAYVTKILTRAEFRRHCDAYKTKSAILANLE